MLPRSYRTRHQTPSTSQSTSSGGNDPISPGPSANPDEGSEATLKRLLPPSVRGLIHTVSG
ncbi:hypothetical protein XPA_001000 [Xanthoria parietina]